jgi:hypothetical protein
MEAVAASLPPVLGSIANPYLVATGAGLQVQAEIRTA